MKKIFLLLSAIFLIICLFISCIPTTSPTTSTNYAPTINSTPSTYVRVGEEYTYDVDATDLDGDTLTYFLTIKPSGMTINSTTGSINWTPTATGEYNVTVEVSDDGSPVESITQSFIIYIEEPLPQFEPIEVASGEINLDEGGVIEVTDPNSELYGLKLTIEPLKNIRENKENPIFTIIKFFLSPDVASCKLPDYQGFLITPFAIKSDFTNVLFGKLEIPYYVEQLINVGVAINSNVKLCRVPTQSCSWEEVSQDKYIVENNVVNIPIGTGDLGYSYTLTVNNTAIPHPSKNPQPGDLLYKSSKWGTNEGWLPGHVGIYVGERYDEKDGKYNVIEAQLPVVKRSYYDSISAFSHDCIYIGARESESGLSHQKRNLIIAFAEGVVGTEYATIETVSSMFWTGLGRGELVKGDNGRFNCVGLAEKAYQLVGIDLVSNYDEGNVIHGPYHILTPAEQWYKTVSASGVLVQNISPKISSLEITPEGSIETNSLVYVTCNATDQDKDTLTYFWTIPGEEEFIKGKQLDLTASSIEGEYEISCRVIDNYGGEDIKSKTITVFDSSATNHPPVISSLTANPSSLTTNQPTTITCTASDQDGDPLIYTWTKTGGTFEGNTSGSSVTWRAPSTEGNHTVECEVSDGEASDSKSVNISVGGSTGSTVSSIEVFPETMNIGVGNSKSIELITAHYDNGSNADIALNTCTYISSNTGVATVDIGVITAIALGSATITVAYTEGDITKTDALAVTVSADVNHAPVITSTPVTSAIKDEPYSYDVNATDSDGDTPVYSLTTKASGMSINDSTGLITWTPTATGSFGVTVKASDGELFDTQSFTITVEEISTTLGQVQLLSPLNGVTLPPGNITFSWNSVSNATKYEFILYNQQGQVALETTYSNASAIVALGDEETITWKVRAGDNSGNWGTWSGRWSLTLKSTTINPVSPTGFSVSSYWNFGWIIRLPRYS